MNLLFIQYFKSQSFLCENAMRSGILQNWIKITNHIGLNVYFSKGSTVYLSKRVVTIRTPIKELFFLVHLKEFVFILVTRITVWIMSIQGENNKKIFILKIRFTR